MHRCLTVSAPLLRAWIHCPRAPEQFVTSPLCLVGYVRWDARSDRVLLSRQSFSAALQVARRFADHPSRYRQIRRTLRNREIQLLRESWTFKWVMVALAITTHPRRDGVLCCHKTVRESQGRLID